MTQLVSHFDQKPVELKGRVELTQHPISAARQFRASDGPIQANVIYAVAHSPVGPPLLVPFGSYDEWSLRDRYNEAIRIMNTLGASLIVCESFREVSRKARLGFRIAAKGPNTTLKRVANTGFDFRHVGAGSVPRNPAPLRWPDEPGFAAAIVSVLENRATEVSLNITSDSSFDLTSNLAVTLKGLGFELGGGRQRTDVTNLHITAQFPTSPRKGWR